MEHQIILLTRSIKLKMCNDVKRHTIHMTNLNVVVVKSENNWKSGKFFFIERKKKKEKFHRFRNNMKLF